MAIGAPSSPHSLAYVTKSCALLGCSYRRRLCRALPHDPAVKVTALPCLAATSGAACGEGDGNAGLAAAVRDAHGDRLQPRCAVPWPSLRRIHSGEGDDHVVPSRMT